MVKLMACKDYSDASKLYENILIMFFVPLIVCLVAVVAWPALVGWKVQDMWRVRGRKNAANATAAHER